MSEASMTEHDAKHVFGGNYTLKTFISQTTLSPALKADLKYWKVRTVRQLKDLPEWEWLDMVDQHNRDEMADFLQALRDDGVIQ